MVMVTPRRGGAAGRALRIARLGAGLTASYLGYQVQGLWLNEAGAEKARRTFGRKQGRRIRDELAALRGPVMKIGQMLSMQSHVFSPEVIEELSGLQAQAPPMHPSLMRAQFRNAFGSYPEELFKSFELEPLAAASLGQVHRAVTRDGEPVCVKIQYPAIREAIANDFRALRAATLPARLTRRLPDAILREAEERMIEETDYRKEADNIDFFRAGLAPVPYLRTPKVIRELSAEKVLTMSFVPGRRLDDLLAEKPSQAWRNQLAIRLMELLFRQVVALGAIHADPHSGNYLFDAEGNVGLIDFGCVKRLEPRAVAIFQEVLWRRWAGDPRRTLALGRRLFAGKECPDDKTIRSTMAEIGAAYDIFYPVDESAEVDFGDPKVLRVTMKLGRYIVTKASRFLPAEFLFLSRSELGLYNAMHQLRCRLPMGRVSREMLARFGSRPDFPSA
jgi:predicted unusual protein kinase regulating ubiquinone biosynthesis (AarF/ABC1/UbiB family)